MSNLGSKYLKKTSSQVPTLKNGATEASSNIDKASLFNEVFSMNFNDALPLLSESDHQCFLADPSSPPPEDILCTEQEILLLIALDTNKNLRTWCMEFLDAQRNCYLYCTGPNRAFKPVNHKWENSFKMETDHLLSRSISLQLMWTISQTTGQYPFSQWSARSWKDLLTALYLNTWLNGRFSLLPSGGFALGNPQLLLLCQLFTTFPCLFRLA